MSTGTTNTLSQHFSLHPHTPGHVFLIEPSFRPTRRPRASAEGTRASGGDHTSTNGDGNTHGDGASQAQGTGGGTGGSSGNHHGGKNVHHAPPPARPTLASLRRRLAQERELARHLKQQARRTTPVVDGDPTQAAKGQGTSLVHVNFNPGQYWGWVKNWGWGILLY